MKCPSESTESLTSRLKVFIFSSVYLTINPGTSSVEASRSCLVELSLAILGVVYTGSVKLSCYRKRKRFYMPLQELVVHFKSEKNL